MRRLLLLLLLHRSLCSTSCRLASNDTKELAADVNTSYCLPATGCTYLTGYHDCVRDNETPKCVYFDVATLKCTLCYPPTMVKPWAIVSANKTGAGPRLCEVD